MTNLRERVQDNFSALPKTQRSLIKRILTEYEEYVFPTVDDAAARLGVHKSTLVRLAQSLGYEGYSELRAQLQALYREEISPGKKLGTALSEVDTESLYPQVVETETLYLKESLKRVRTEDIHEAARLIVGARKVFICGRGHVKIGRSVRHASGEVRVEEFQDGLQRSDVRFAELPKSVGINVEDGNDGVAVHYGDDNLASRSRVAWYVAWERFYVVHYDGRPGPDSLKAGPLPFEDLAGDRPLIRADVQFISARHEVEARPEIMLKLRVEDGGHRRHRRSQ